MLITVAQAKASRLQQVAASCPNSSEFLSLLNEATERLMNRGDWPGTVIPIRVCSYAGCVVFPRWVGEVRKLNVCGQPVSVTNFWWSFFDDADRHTWETWCGPECRMTLQGQTPVFQDILGEGRLVRAYPLVSQDVGKTVTIFGTDNNGQPLRTLNADNTWSDGVVITLAMPFGTTSTYIRKIDRVLIESGTQGRVMLFGYNVSGDVLETVATYEPGEVNPSFTRYKLHVQRCGTSATDCGTLKSLVALIKLRFIPAVTDNDLVLIENIPALKLMIQSIKREEAGDEQGARMKEKSAIRELNLQMWNRDQESGITVSLGETGGTLVGTQQCF